MGLLGLLITVAIMIFGTGYLLFGSSHGNFSAENPGMTDNQKPITGNSNQEQVTMTGEIAQGMAVLEAAKNAVKQETADSQKAADAIDSTDNQKPTTDNVVAKEAKAAKEAVQDRLVSFGYAESSGRKIDTVVLHSSYNNQGGERYSVDKVIDIWKSYSVAPHYLIDRKGNILRLVEDKNIAYHAGVAKMPDGRTDVNAFSIGVEILNGEDDEYTAVQYKAVNDLVASLKKQYGVKYVVGHADIAPGRKTDPWNFDWKRLK
jgi:N-acetyl-anhydromuramyl-L-alanine amidase AmpD